MNNENEHLNKIKTDVLDPRIVKSLDFQRSNTYYGSKLTSNGRKKPFDERDDRARTGRFNETARCNTVKKGSTSRVKTTANTSKSKFILCAEEEDREMWVSLL